MPLFEVTPVGRSKHCEIHSNGAIMLTQFVLNRTGWRAGVEGDRINIQCLADDGVLVLCFAKAQAEQAGFKLHFANRSTTGGSGGMLRCARLASRILRPRIKLPIQEIVPLFPEKEVLPFQLAFILQLPAWIESDFSQTAAEGIPTRTTGVYLLQASDRKAYRYGEGNVQARLKEHLKTNDHVRTTKRFGYFPVADKGDCQLLEYLLLLRHKQQNGGQLPPGNRITA